MLCKKLPVVERLQYYNSLFYKPSFFIVINDKEPLEKTSHWRQQRSTAAGATGRATGDNDDPQQEPPLVHWRQRATPGATAGDEDDVVINSMSHRTSHWR